MNSDTLTRQAIRLAQRESRKRGRALTKEDVLKLHIQTAGPWRRALFVVIGLCIVGFGAFCYFAKAPWWIWAPLGIAGLVTIVIGLVGTKVYLDRELQKLGPAKIADAVLTGIFNGLT